MKDKIKLGLLRWWTLIRLTRLSFVIYLAVAVLLFVSPLYLYFLTRRELNLFELQNRIFLRTYFHILSAIFGCVIGAVTVSRFGFGKKGELLRLVPEKKTASFITVSLCELTKGILSFAFSYGLVQVLLVLIYHAPSNFFEYMFGGLFGESIRYLLLYFSVGVLFSVISGRVITAVLGCITYYLGTGLVCYTVIGVYPYLPKENGGLLSLLCAPFIHNSPVFDLFFRLTGSGAIIVDENLGFGSGIDDLGVSNGCSIFGILFTSIAFYLLGILIFKYRRVEELGKPYCFPFVAPIITSALTVECYFMAIIAPWGGINNTVERLSNLFGVGKLLPGTEYVTVFTVGFFIFSALASCSVRHIFKYVKLFPTLAVATYAFQAVCFGGML